MRLSGQFNFFYENIFSAQKQIKQKQTNKTKTNKQKTAKAKGNNFLHTKTSKKGKIVYFAFFSV